MNIPTEDKKKHGRKETLARYKKTGQLYAADKLRDFIVPSYGTNVSADLCLTELNGINLIPDVNLDDLSDSLKGKIVHGVPDGDDRSKAFYSVIAELFRMKFSANAIFSLFATYPNGIAQKYISRGVPVLKTQVESCFKKILQNEAEDLSSLSDDTNVSKQAESHPYAIEFSTISAVAWGTGVCDKSRKMGLV